MTRGAWTAAAVAVALAGLTLAASAAVTAGTVAHVGFDPLRALLPRGGTVPADARVLLLSDEPEQVPGPGILYDDVVDGPFRVFLYAVAAAPRPLYFEVVAADAGARPVTVRVTRTGVGGPSTAWVQAAAEAQDTFFSSHVDHVVAVAPGTARVIAPPVSLYPAMPGELLNAIVDGTTDGRVLVGTVAVYRRDAPLGDLGVLPPARVPSRIMRGTFAHADFDVAFAVFPWEQRLRLQDSGDYLRGRSALDGVPVRDAGNYGVVYRIEVDQYAGGVPALAELAAVDVLRLDVAVLRWSARGAAVGAAWAGPAWGDGLAALPVRWWEAPTRLWRRLLRSLRVQASYLHWMPQAGVEQPSTVYLQGL